MAAIIMVLVSYFAIAIASVIYAVMKLCQPAISKESQKLVLVRHVLYILGFIISQLYVFISFVYLIDKNWDYSQAMISFVSVTKILFEA